MVFHDCKEIVQMFISTESKAMMELPSTTIIEGSVYLMAAYYVLDVQYPIVAVRHSFFFSKTLLWTSMTILDDHSSIYTFKSVLDFDHGCGHTLHIHTCTLLLILILSLVA